MDLGRLRERKRVFRAAEVLSFGQKFMRPRRAELISTNGSNRSIIALLKRETINIYLITKTNI
jgi:hypothetical protein